LAWTIEYTTAATRSLSHLDRKTAKRILDYMDEKVAASEDPRALGKALSGVMSGLWRYRVGDYRIVCDIQDKRVCILVVDVGHRGNIYRRKK
jgi:mRNA interferase RelE/StbE